MVASMPIEPRDGIEANGTTREIAGDGRKQSGVAQDRRPSQICRLERVAGRGIIAPRRKRSAHLHRPWRASDFNGLWARHRFNFKIKTVSRTANFLVRPLRAGL
jgi:hypothetical protein